MKKIVSRGQIYAAAASARSLAFRRIDFQISPLWAIWLGTLTTMALLSGLYALQATMGRLEVDESAAVPEWKPPSLAIETLDPPKPASADVESLSRPLFSKYRKPAPKAAGANLQADGSNDAGSLSVSAIVVDRNTRQAFFASSDTPEGAWKKTGDTVDSWTITAIAPMEVILQSGIQKKILKLYAHIPDQNGDDNQPAKSQTEPSKKELSSPASISRP